jgi:hypothetical protein
MVVFVAFLGFVGYTYITITKKFDSSRRWDLPSRVYSDATPLVPGMTYPRALLEPKLNHVGYHEVRDRVANPGEYRYVGGNLEIYLQNFDYPGHRVPRDAGDRSTSTARPSARCAASMTASRCAASASSRS